MSKMTPNHVAALFVAYFFARFNDDAVLSLGFRNATDAFRQISAHLNMKFSSLKNMRDEFDGHIASSRKGWYQRPLRPSRVKIVELLQDSDQQEITLLIRQILLVPGGEVEGLDKFAVLLDEPESKSKRPFSEMRGLTGVAAEEFFMKSVGNGDLSDFARITRDTRLAGVGYDFEVDDKAHFVEVKGLADDRGGIMLTDKEWTVAKELGSQYVLAIVSEVHVTPEIHLYFDPANRFDPRQRIQTVLQLSWHIPANQLRGMPFEKLSGRAPLPCLAWFAA